MGDPQSIDEWLALARQHEAAARAICELKDAGGQSIFHAGTGVECALKAYIMHKERLNTWPDGHSRRELHTHDIRKLADIAEIIITPTDTVAPSWHLMRQWDRNQAYDPKRMPRKVARSWVEASFGKEGVVTWIRQTLLHRS